MNNRNINIYAIPQNYTDSGRLLGGLVETNNLIEAIIVVVPLVAFILYLPFSFTIRIVTAMIVALPIGILALTGINGDTLFQFVEHMFKFLKTKRKLHFRKVGDEDYGEKGKNQKGKKTKG